LAEREDISRGIASVLLQLRTCSQNLRVTPAMEAGLADHVWNFEEIALLVS
jgi:hypothetical protein